MPQLDIQDFAPQIVWLVLTFIGLYFIMSRVALPRVGTILEERRSRISADLAAAAQLREETDKAIQDYEKALADAKSRAQEIGRQAREEIAADIERERAKVDETINQKLADAEKRITEMKEAAIAHVEEIATETADALVARILSKQPKRSELQSAVKEALGK